MTAIISLLVMLVFSMTVIRVGGVALRLTGMAQDAALDAGGVEGAGEASDA